LYEVIYDQSQQAKIDQLLQKVDRLLAGVESGAGGLGRLGSLYEEDRVLDRVFTEGGGYGTYIDQAEEDSPMSEGLARAPSLVREKQLDYYHIWTRITHDSTPLYEVREKQLASINRGIDSRVNTTGRLYNPRGGQLTSRGLYKDTQATHGTAKGSLHAEISPPLLPRQEPASHLSENSAVEGGSSFNLSPAGTFKAFKAFKGGDGRKSCHH